MKNKYVITIVAVTAMCVLIMVMAGFSYNENEAVVKRLMHKRTDIMQNVLLNKVSEEDGQDKLKEVENGKLYTTDCKAISDYKNSDYDLVLDMKFVDIEEVSNVSDMLTFICDIEWTTMTYDGVKTVKHSHFIAVKETGDGYKLVAMEPIDGLFLP